MTSKLKTIDDVQTQIGYRSVSWFTHLYDPLVLVLAAITVFSGNTAIENIVLVAVWFNIIMSAIVALVMRDVIKMVAVNGKLRSWEQRKSVGTDLILAALIGAHGWIVLSILTIFAAIITYIFTTGINHAVDEHNERLIQSNR